MKRSFAIIVSCLLIAACGDAEEKGPATNNGSSNNATMNNATTNNSTSNNATTNNATTNNATTNNSAQRLEAHGCTFETAVDMTGESSVDLSADGAWTIGYNYCVIVDAGTEVTLDGNFSSHPLEGGVQPTTDASSPFTITGEGLTGEATATVTLSEAGDYPYFCVIHPTSMNGVVYVQ